VNYSNTAVATNWSASISDSETSKDVDSATGYPEAPFKIQCEDEVILVETKSGTTFSDMTRGFEGTTAASHGTTDEVKHVATSGDMEAIPYDTWFSSLFRRPEAAHADDQEFNDALGGTTLTVTGTGTWTQTKGVLNCVFHTQNTGDTTSNLYSLTPSTHPVTVETAYRFMGKNSTYYHVGVGFTDGVIGSSNVITAMTQYSSEQIGAWHGTLTNMNTSVATIISPGAGGMIYARLIWSAANTFKTLFSADGIGWTQLALANVSKTMTPTHFGPVLSSWAATPPAVATFEYLRVTESDLSL
jgi:hypothetical protein